MILPKVVLAMKDKGDGPGFWAMWLMIGVAKVYDCWVVFKNWILWK